MKRAIFLPPLIAAILFTVPAAWQMIQAPTPSYVPVVYELLMLGFSYGAALAVNLVLVLPLAWLLIRFYSASWLTGLLYGLILAFIGDVVAYAFEIFDYRPSIFDPAYIYTVFMPLLFLLWTGFFCLVKRSPSGKGPDPAVEDETAPPQHE